MHGPAAWVGPCRIEYNAVEGWTGGIPSGAQDLEPFDEIDRRPAARERQAPPSKEWCKYSHFQSVRVIRRGNAQASVQCCKREPCLKSLGRSQHISVTERNQLRQRGCSRGLQDEGNGARVRPLGRRRKIARGRIQRQPEFSSTHGESLNNPDPAALRYTSHGRVARLAKYDGIKTQDPQALINLSRREFRIEWNRDGAT